MDRIDLGVVTTEVSGSHHLADAARRHPGVVVHDLAADAGASDKLAAVIVDVPLDQRGQVVADLGRRWHVPILVEMPVAANVEQSQEVIAGLAGVQVYSLNPLCYRVPTARLLDELAAPDDPLESIFATWRFKQSTYHDQVLPQLVDFVIRLAGAEPSRLSAMTRQVPAVLLALLRFPNDVVASVEIGNHLPESLPDATELLIECFSRDNAYQCQADNQTVRVDGALSIRRDWLPPAAERMVGAFVDMLHGTGELTRNVVDDQRILALCGDLRLAAAHGSEQHDPRQGVDQR